MDTKWQQPKPTKDMLEFLEMLEALNHSAKEAIKDLKDKKEFLIQRIKEDGEVGK